MNQCPLDVHVDVFLQLIETYFLFSIVFIGPRISCYLVGTEVVVGGIAVSNYLQKNDVEKGLQTQLLSMKAWSSPESIFYVFFSSDVQEEVH